MHREVVLVRHGEVANPAGVVYGSMPGFGLSVAGRKEAEAAADHLADRSLAAVVSSPLLRAQDTAVAVALRHGLSVTTDARLTEWRLSDRWAGIPWTEVDDQFPGELTEYWRTPTQLPFAPESLAEVAARMRAAVEHACLLHGAGSIVFVSHQDPLQAARLDLTGRPLEQQHTGKPSHAAVITLQPGPASDWVEVEHWAPPHARSGPPAAT